VPADERIPFEETDVVAVSKDICRRESADP